VVNKTFRTNKQLNQRIFLLGAIALAGGLASQAKADVSYTISDASLETVAVQYQGNDYNVLAGGIGITASGSSGNAPSSYVTVCTDFGGSLYLGSTYKFNDPQATANVLPGYSPVSPWMQNASAAIQNAATLFANYRSVLTGGNFDAAAGLQLAIWTALYDSTQVGVVNTGSGALFLGVQTTQDATAIADMNTYLGALPGLNPTTSVDILTPSPAGSSQGNADGVAPQSLLIYAPVPEASTVVTATLLLVSFGLCSLKSFGKFRA
jgi:hypothetical protein